MNPTRQTERHSYLGDVFSDTQIPHSDTSLGVEVLPGHVNIIGVFVFILVLAVVFPLLCGGNQNIMRYQLNLGDDISAKNLEEFVVGQACSYPTHV